MILFLLSVSLLFVTPALAQEGPKTEFKLYVGGEAERTDNAFLEPKSGTLVDEITYRPFARLESTLAFQALQGAVKYRYDHEAYDEATFPDRSTFVGESTLVWQVGSRLAVDVFHSRDLVTEDSVDPETPANQTERSLLQIGPRLSVFSGPSGTLDIGASYTETTFDDSLIAESTMNGVSISATRRIIPLLSSGFEVLRREVSSDRQQLEYDVERASVRIFGDGGRFRYALMVGRNKITRLLGANLDGPVAEALFEFETTNSLLKLKAVRDLTDSSLGLATNSTLQGSEVTGDGSVGVQDVVERSRVELTWQFNLNRSTLTLMGSSDRQDYAAESRDSKTETVQLRYTYRLRRGLSVEYNVSVNERFFEFGTTIGEREFDDVEHRLSFNYRSSDHWRFSGWIVDRERRSAIPLDRFEEARVGLLFEFRI